jgi:hypothetical protein
LPDATKPEGDFGFSYSLNASHKRPKNRQVFEVQRPAERAAMLNGLVMF